MENIVVISCTNRPDSNTLKVSRIYEELVAASGGQAKLLDFNTLPHSLAFTETFGNRTAPYADLIREFVTDHRKFIFVVPEYNGSFPGILKTFLDSMHPREWWEKYACLVGVSDGRAGNLRGLEHLTGVLQYLKMHVYHNKLPISVIGKVMSPEGKFISEEQLKVCAAQVNGFLRI